MSSAKIRIGIVDDQALVRTGFRMVLEATTEFNVVAEAEDGHGAIELARTRRLDVILMDVRMPKLNGIAATEYIVATNTDTKILVLTTFDLDEYAFAAIRAGASGFLLKDARPEELATAIRAIHTGDAVLSPRITRRMVELFTNKLPLPLSTSGEDSAITTVELKLKNELSALSPREIEILVAAAEGKNNAEIAENFYISESTVKTHIKHLLAKLSVRDRVHLVIIAYETGLVK